jgi:hypothetical protein
MNDPNQSRNEDLFGWKEPPPFGLTRLKARLAQADQRRSRRLRRAAIFPTLAAAGAMALFAFVHTNPPPTAQALPWGVAVALGKEAAPKTPEVRIDGVKSATALQAKKEGRVHIHWIPAPLSGSENPAILGP